MTRRRLVLALSLATAALADCQRHDAESHSAAVASAKPRSGAPLLPSSVLNPAEQATLGASEIVNDVPIYALKTTFLDQDARPTKLEVFQGHPVLVAMFYAACPQACPRLIGHIKDILANLSEPERARLFVLLVTIDPENDDPAALRAVMTRYALDPARFRLLTGKEDDIREVAAILGVKYRTSAGTINHSSVITLVDGEGRVRARYDGLADSKDPATRDVRALLAKR